jgi:hypothetical protein
MSISNLLNHRRVLSTPSNRRETRCQSEKHLSAGYQSIWHCDNFTRSQDKMPRRSMARGSCCSSRPASDVGALTTKRAGARASLAAFDLLRPIESRRHARCCGISVAGARILLEHQKSVLQIFLLTELGRRLTTGGKRRQYCPFADATHPSRIESSEPGSAGKGFWERDRSISAHGVLCGIFLAIIRNRCYKYCF